MTINNPKMLKNHHLDEIIQQVVAILDSKLQKLDVYLKAEMSVLKDADEIDLSVADDNLLQEETLLTRIEYHSRATRLLLMLRERINNSNAATILFLLSNDHFLELEEKLLQGLINLDVEGKNVEAEINKWIEEYHLYSF